MESLKNLQFNLKEMAIIEALVEELNHLCHRWITQKEQFKEKDRFFEVLTSIKEQGYSLAFPRLKLDVPEYELLSEEGKKDFKKMTEVKKMKMEAIDRQEFEQAANLRDEEKSLIWKIQSDFSLTRNNDHFILSGKVDDVILFNDPDNVLITLIK